MSIPKLTLETLKKYDQTHLVRFWDQLNPLQQKRLIEQINQIDFPLVEKLAAQKDEQGDASESPAERARRATSPEQLIRLPVTQEDRDAQFSAADAGEELLRSGKVGAILVAGGQGSRLGFNDPKGMFPIGPVSDRTLFQVLCEQILARSRRAGVAIPYFIMTSEATHTPTIAFFEKHRYFGLNEDDVFFFQQSSLPAVEVDSSRVLLERTDRVATSPDGHGGMLRALQRHGMIDIMIDRGIEHLYYHQVDNPTAIVCDPELLGYHVQSNSELTTKVVAKVSPQEKMGVLVTVDGQTQIIEYSDLPAEEAERKQKDGNYVFWAGNTAVHVFHRPFIERLLGEELSLPFHIAHKKVATVNDAGETFTPDQPNARKFEQFIFDALPQAKVALVVEGERSREFNPVKNAEGNDSPTTSRAALIRIARDWIDSAGGAVENDAPVEISPLFALDREELQIRIEPGQIFNKPTVLGE
ncbi:MAG TPA: UDPGP type 1 family protein [Planctomicrobium sp.]|nr:UDPGP type 1 family protein [Planctomicrobium sp.]